MKQIIYFGLTFFLLTSNSCELIKRCPKPSIHTETSPSISDTSGGKSTESTPDISRMNSHGEINPIFPGGTQAMFDHIYLSPLTDSLSGREQTVYVSFSISSSGELSDFKIARSLNPECDAEALRIVKSMPKWIPAYQYGKFVESKYMLPIRFKVPEQK